jgi:hypothetical protein
VGAPHAASRRCGDIDHRTGEGVGANDHCAMRATTAVNADRAIAIRLAAAIAQLTALVTRRATHTASSMHCPRSVSQSGDKGKSEDELRAPLASVHLGGDHAG